MSIVIYGWADVPDIYSMAEVLDNPTMAESLQYTWIGWWGHHLQGSRYVPQCIAAGRLAGENAERPARLVLMSESTVFI